jgi:hypothetical protein
MFSIYLSEKFDMDTINQNTEVIEKRELPGMLNVLTILTFIGCGLAYLSTLWGYFKAGTEMDDLEALQDQAGDNEFVNEMAQGSLELAQKSYDNRYILLISGLLFTTLCLIGALQMRKLKKSGYLLYVIGELAPVVVTAVIMGFSLIGGIATIFSAIFAVLFVILYTMQKKYLVY